MACRRESAVKQTGTGQMRNESTGTCYNVHAWLCLSTALLTFLLQAAARHVFSNTWPSEAEICLCIHSGFIIYLNKTKTVEWKGAEPIRARTRHGECGYLQELLSSQAAFHLFASLKCQSTAWGPCAPIGNPDLSSMGIDKCKMHCGADWWRRILRHCYYFEVSTPIVTLICAFTQRQLLSFPYQWINLISGTRPEKY